MIEAMLGRYQGITFPVMLEMPVVKIFDYFEWAVYFMQMETYLAMLKL